MVDTASNPRSLDRGRRTSGSNPAWATVRPYVKKNQSKTNEKRLEKNHLPCRHEDLGSIPSPHVKSWAHVDEGMDHTLYMHALSLITNKPLKCAILSPDQELVLDG